ncbi:PREDICTED: kunitz-type serine protease inhibitor long epsilon-dendrotoxin Arg55-like [Rhagoletis zephyria]|uniref:kunitz-type serine protease inhibitor long epsilon-dendrotoxin Arg55-like n=1 Tax=Rhagoletis zephyria TaxID=28612 RepID=UPI000811429C|nr:PREDICTED: kunitz-type serine protease inhibitor long epsilon-dendrotoxin Arg55-like [Rhagoletis zephyria]
MAAINIQFLIFSFLLIVLNHKAYAQSCILPAYPSCIEQLDEGRTGPGCVPGSQWYYNTILRRCLFFSYRGCGGNANRYCSLALCERFCRPRPPRVVVG